MKGGGGKGGLWTAKMPIHEMLMSAMRFNKLSYGGFLSILLLQTVSLLKILISGTRF